MTAAHVRLAQRRCLLQTQFYVLSQVFALFWEPEGASCVEDEPPEGLRLSAGIAGLCLSSAAVAEQPFGLHR